MPPSTTITYPPTFEDWSQWEEKNVRLLWVRIDELRKKRRNFLQKNLCAALRIPEETFSTWKNSKDWKAVGERHFNEILSWLYTANLLFEGTHESVQTADKVYGGLSNFIHMNNADYVLASKYITGKYLAFRRSSYLGGDFVLQGFINITVPDEAGAIKVFEHFSIPKGIAEKEKDYIREGYLFYKDHVPIIISRKLNYNDIEFVIIQTISPIPSESHGQQVEHMDGVIFHLQDNEIYATRIALVRTDTRQPTETLLKAVKPDDLKPDIKNSLRKGVDNIGGFLLRFT